MKVPVRKFILKWRLVVFFINRYYFGHKRRLSAVALLTLFCFWAFLPQLAGEAKVQEGNAKIPPPAQPSHVKRGPRAVKHFTPKVSFSQSPTDSEISIARIFLEPLVPLPGKTEPADNAAFAQALRSYKSQSNLDEVGVLMSFLAKHPKSRWRPSLELSVARIRSESGYLSDALKLWKNVWAETKDETSPQIKAIADDAVTQLMLLYGRVGQVDELDKYLKEVDKRPFFGSAEPRAAAARVTLTSEKAAPGKAFKCGPYAINSILNIGKPYPALNPKVGAFESCKDGTNLSQVQVLAEQVGLHYQMAKRTAGSAIITPAVMHWRLGHFAALLSRKGDRYHIQDPTFDEKGNMWLAAKAIDAESDGYFLVPQGALPAGWVAVSQDDAKKVWGKGQVFGSSFPCCPTEPIGSPGGGGPPGGGAPPGGGTCKSCSCKGLAQAAGFFCEATLKVFDTPLGYSPPAGPSIQFLVNYNHMEGNQPGNWSFSNFGPDWSLNWVSYLTLDSSQNATVHVRGGGYEQYNYMVTDNIQNPYLPYLTSQATLTVVSPGVYQRQLPDGSTETFSQEDSSGRIFMTQVNDPQGNSAFIQYSNYNQTFRITSITDTIGQVSTISHLSNTPSNPGYYKIAQITDPFGRSCSFTYDSTQTYLVSITDVIGLVSQFAYDTTSSFITLLNTPYGTTGFTQFLAPGSVGQSFRVLRFDFPDGTAAVIRATYGNAGVGGVNGTNYWDRELMQQAPVAYLEGQQTGGGTGGEFTQWLCSITNVQQPVIDLINPVLDGQILYKYQGESPGDASIINLVGGSNKPISVSQVGTTSSYQNNAQGHVTQSIDPIGRTFSYLYAANGIDLLEKRQTTGTNNQLNGKWFFNSNNHLPSKYIDGGGFPTQYSYNNFGQLTTLTDPAGNVWTRKYNADGFLSQIDGPLPGNSDITTFQYDGYNRIYSVTDSEGYTVVFSYDNMDRITQILYPDGTTEQTVYNRLDAVAHKDRIGRWSQSSYDSMERLTYEIDPLGRKTQYSWCACGSLSSITDPNGNVTAFAHDLQGRVTQKTYPDGTYYMYVYDTLGRLQTRTDALGQITTYSYKPDNTLSAVAYTNTINSTPTVNLRWDQNYPRLLEITNTGSMGVITDYTYGYYDYITNVFTDPTIQGAGMLETVSNSSSALVNPGAIVSYQYDQLGRTTQRQINDPGTPNTVTWAYDQMSRVISETNKLGTFNYSYVDDLHYGTTIGSSKGTTRLASISYPNGQVTNFSWYGPNQDERLQGITNLDPTGKTRSQFNYAYDSAGQIINWGQQNASLSPANYSLGYDQAGQLTSAQSGFGTTSPPYANQYYYNYDPAANRTSAQSTVNQTAGIGGSLTTGDVLTITVQDSGLSGGSVAVNSPAVTGSDTFATVASKLAAAICANASLQAIGVNASATGSLIYIRSASPNITIYSYTQGSNSEQITFGVNSNAVQTATIGLVGSAYSSTQNDNFKITVYDARLSGGSEAVNYQVPLSQPSPSAIATAIAYNITHDSNLQGIGVSASSAGPVVNIKSTSSDLTTYSAVVTPTTVVGKETVTFGTNTSGNITATIDGTITTNDVVSLTVCAGALPGGQESIAYQVSSSDSLTHIASQLAANINADTRLQTYGVTATSSGAVVTIGNSQSTPTYTKSTSGTETITLGTNSGGNISATIGGTVTAGDTLTITASSAGLPAATSASYTVQSGDTLTSIAAGLSAQINQTGLWRVVGIGSSSASSVVNISYKPINYPSYRSYITGGATETISLAMNNNGAQTAKLTGSVHASDVLGIVVNDFGLSGGKEKATYTVQSSDTLPTIAAGIASAINGDTNLQAIGVSATAPSSSNLLVLTSLSQNPTTYGTSVTSGATEGLTFGINPNGTHTATINGTVTSGDTLKIIINDSGLSTGSVIKSYSPTSMDTAASIASQFGTMINGDTNLQNIGVSATVVSNVVNILSTSQNSTTYGQWTNRGATESIALGGAGVVQSVYNSLNELVGTGPGGNVLYQGTTNKPVKSNTLSSSVISLTANPTRQSTTYTGGATDFQGAVTFGANQGNYGNTTASIFYESPASENFYITTYNPALPGGQETVNYPVAGGTAAQVATNLAALMTADSKLQSIGLSATASGTVITITINNPTYTASTSSGATERFTVGPNFNAPNTAGTACSVGVQGTVTAGDTVSLTVNYPALSGGQYTTPAYTVQSPDTLASIASALSSKIISGTPLQAANVNVTSSVTVPLTAPTSQSFSGSPTTVAGGNTEAISATDGGNNTQTNFYQLPVNNQPTTSLTYDFNGNMTSDGTNTYQWDAENRLIQVNYPTGANSQFTYDGLNRCVKIVETTGSTKQFIWDQATICEARDGSGSVLNQYFKYGQTLAGSPYYFALDHLGSIRLLSDGSGNVQAEYDYDPFGRKRKLQGSVDADFQYAGYYYHSATGLSLTWHRAYAPSIGRWLSRDPATAEFGTPNPFLYAENDPASLTDPTGLDVRVFKTDENTYEFDLYILFVGETKLVSKFVQGIAYYWSGHFGKYCITTKVIQAADKSGNTITVKKNGLVNDTLIPGPTGTWTEQAMGIFTPSWGAAHEAGHLMGLQDTYAANTPGLGFGIMGGAPGTRPTEDEVKQILDRFSF